VTYVGFAVADVHRKYGCLTWVVPDSARRFGRGWFAALARRMIMVRCQVNPSVRRQPQTS
jgi:hypothetical protein